MIIYQKKYLGLYMLGLGAPCSPALRALIPSTIAAILSCVLSATDLVATDRSVMEHPYPFQVFCFVLGFLLVFRTNFAYNRYMQGVQHISQMTSKWGDAMLQLSSFDTMTSEKDKMGRETLRLEVVHLMSLLHGVALLKLRADSDVSNLKPYERSDSTSCQGFPTPWLGPPFRAIGVSIPDKGLASSSCASLHQDDSVAVMKSYASAPLHVIGGVRPREAEVLKAVDDKAFVVMQWIVDVVVLQGKFKYLEAEGPIISRVYQFLSDGTLGYSAARKLTEIPFPFAWAQVILALLCIYTLSCPVLMAAWIEDTWVAALWTAIAVWVFVTINEVNRDMEDPFLGSMPHETLPLPVLQADFNNRLWSLQTKNRENRFTAVNPQIGELVKQHLGGGASAPAKGTSPSTSRAAGSETSPLATVSSFQPENIEVTRNKSACGILPPEW